MEKINFLFHQYKRKCPEYRKPFLILFFIYLLAFSAILRANYTYADDIGRTFAGYHGWLDWSRWTTEILATFMHANWKLTDISPFPQIVACAIMAAGGIVILEIFRGTQKINRWNILAVSLTALAPYFLGIISYKFDSPYMALAFFASVVPFLFRNGSEKRYAIVSVLCILIMCTSYQAYSGVYPMTAFFLTVQNIRNGEKLKENIRFLVLSAGCYVVSVAAFWLLLMRENGVSVFSFSSMISDTIQRYINYYRMVYADFSVIWLFLTVIVVLVFLYIFTCTEKMKKWSALLLGIITVFINTILCFGAYLFISREAYDTRAMSGLNVLLALLAVFISFHAKNCIPKLTYAALTWCFFGFALTHGNALAQEQNYIDYRVHLAVDDLNELDVMKTDVIKELHVEGYIGNAPVNENMAAYYPILKRTIYSGFNEGALGEYYICNYLNIPNIKAGSDENLNLNLPVLKDTMFHTIKGNETSVVIVFK